MSTVDATTIIRLLGLTRHPEGGWFRENFRDQPAEGAGRGASTAIYYLLQAGEVSAWHRVDAAEVWHWYAGAPLALAVSTDGVATDCHTLGPDLLSGERPQYVVPKGGWQTARSLGAWSLVGCTVAPAFDFAGFELALPGWQPGRS